MSGLSVFLGQLIRGPAEFRAVAATAREIARLVPPPEYRPWPRSAPTRHRPRHRAMQGRGLPRDGLEVHELNAAVCDWL